jgi:hypothetical protein
MRLIRFATAFALAVSLSFALDGPEWFPTRIVNIEYPLLALQSQTQGAVKIRCGVRADGSVIECKVLSGRLLLAGAVFARIGEWKFRRGPLTASQPPEAVILTFNFRLEEPPVTSTSRHEATFIFEYPDTATIVSHATLLNPIMRGH